MSWIQKLYETFDAVDRLGQEDSASESTPESHTTANAHIEVVLDENGGFKRARVLSKDEAKTCIPCTEESCTRSGIKPKAHPLCDSLQYLAKDFREHGGLVTKGFIKEPTEPHAGYLKQLRGWVDASGHPSLSSILKYIESGNLINDLKREKVLPFAEDGMFLKNKATDGESHSIWSVLAAGQLPEDAVVRWRVETPGRDSPGGWEDQNLIGNWRAHYPTTITRHGLCMVEGKQAPLASFHPAKLRHGADKAKIISSNDSSGFTFRGRFTDPEGSQVCGVGYEVTQKAHSALRWLIARQGYKSGTQAFVSWAASGKLVPQPLDDDYSWLEKSDEADHEAAPSIDHSRDIGKSFAHKLNRYIAGYEASLDPTEAIVVLGLDSATPGRMSIIFYRELLKSEFLERLKNWHLALAWLQPWYVRDPGADNKKTQAKGHWAWRVQAPSPRLIAAAAYGLKTVIKDKDKKLLRATVERILPCIVDGRELPRDLVECCVSRATNRVGLDYWEWEQTLGAACALFKGNYARLHNPEQRRDYGMALEPERTSRDYLYGRLLAIAEHIEAIALYVAGEKRPTTAARLMQRFADYPFSTWRTIEMSLQPYMQRLQTRRCGFLHNMRALLDDVVCLFQPEDFEDERRLSGEFLLGFHCQRQELKTKKDQETDADTGGEEQ